MTFIDLQNFRFHLEPKSPLRMPAYNKGSTLRLTPEGNVIRCGLVSTFRLSGVAQAGRIVGLETGIRQEAIGNNNRHEEGGNRQQYSGEDRDRVRPVR